MTREQIKILLETLLKKLQVDFKEVVCEQNGEQQVFQIYTDESNTLIGRRGEIIRALNHIAKRAVIVENNDEKVHFIVDVNGYRMKKIEEIEQNARLLAERARSLKYNVEMPPMSAYERMLVHSALAEEENIRTESHGEGRERRVVICYEEYLS